MKIKIISNKKLREFGLIIGFSFPIIIGFIIPLVFGHPFRLFTLFISFPLIILGIIKPSFLYFPYKIWMIIGQSLGWLNSRIILGIVFIFILIPIALFMKFFNYDPLKKRKNKLIPRLSTEIPNNGEVNNIAGTNPINALINAVQTRDVII